ncbi:NAD(P)-binding protein [Amniculicola lignicola CBS 123094]|uniref:NAD(P)-binding protein n=1 Tax=Amniculicola lignicola CBS 123094 TaxID=1392246 RepID=A0A6A5VZU4_9PLEO|nr:NAD(P)-binding protein [Amniculicola lignicola CBS 123094]
MASMVIKSLQHAATQPLLTGPLLWILTRGPADIREHLLAPFHSNILSRNSTTRTSRFIAILKFLTVYGLARRINTALNKLAWNNWCLTRQGKPFRFGGEKQELVFITGGSSGFGYEMVKRFSKVARVVVLDVQTFPPELGKLPDVYLYHCDLCDTCAVEETCAEIRKRHGDPTVLINNAGIGAAKLVLDTTNHETEKLFKVNIISHFTLIREFLPGMLRMNKGHIVTIASMASFFASPGLLDYSCSKIAALYLSEGIRAELLSRYGPAGRTICTTSIHPSWHATHILTDSTWQNIKSKGYKIDPPSNVVDVVVEQVLKGRSGRVCVPLEEEAKMGFRSWPRWWQDVVGGLMRMSGGVQLGREEVRL